MCCLEKIRCTVYVEGVEKLFHASSLKEDERREKDTRASSKSISSPKTQKDPALRSRKGRDPSTLETIPRERGKEERAELQGWNQKPEAEGQRPLCRNFTTAEGCSVAANADTIIRRRLGSAGAVSQSLILQRTAPGLRNPTKSRENKRRDPKAKPRRELGSLYRSRGRVI